MVFCDICNKEIDVDEFQEMQENEVSESDKEWNITKKTCMRCRKEIRDARKEFSGDHSPLHPEETVEEFESHEDHETN